jgi:osmotically inducible protein OsmC
MPTRTAEAEWQGTLKEGAGTVALGSGAFKGPFSFVSRFEDGSDANPEELLGAAHAGCFTMALNNRLFQNGFAPKRVHTVAHVLLEKSESGMSVSNIHLVTEAEIPGISEEDFRAHATAAKDTCIISRALSAVPMTLEAKLV